jgi:hypothetical protein
VGSFIGRGDCDGRPGAGGGGAAERHYHASVMLYRALSYNYYTNQRMHWTDTFKSYYSTSTCFGTEAPSSGNRSVQRNVDPTRQSNYYVAFTRRHDDIFGWCSNYHARYIRVQRPLSAIGKVLIKKQNCNKYKTRMMARVICIFKAVYINFGARGRAVVEAVRYKPEGRRFDSRWYHWDFSLT